MWHKLTFCKIFLDLPESKNRPFERQIKFLILQDYFGCITDSRHFRHLVSDSDQMDEGNTSSCLGKLMPRTGKRNENINFMQKGNLQHSS